MTVSEYAAGWLARQQGRVQPTTLRAYAGACRRVILPRFGALQLDALTTPLIRRWLSERIAANYARATVTGELAALSTLLTDAMLDGLIGTNPARGAGRRLWPTRHPEAKSLTADQLERLIYAADLDRATWLGSWVRIGARTGLRPGEQLALEPRDLTPQGLRVERTYHGVGKFGPPKGGRARLVEASPAVMRLLLERGEVGADFLFRGRRRDRPMDPASLDRAFARAIRRAGLPAHLTPHCLRHTYASLLLSAGAPVQFVRQQMGHASIRLTVDVYGSGILASRPDLVGLLDTAGEPARHPPQPARRATIIPLSRATRRARPGW